MSPEPTKPTARRLKLTFTPQENTPGELTVLDLPFAEITAGLVHEVGQKSGSAYMPALFDPPNRKNANVKAMTALVLDFDGTEAGALNALSASLKARGLAFWWHHTFSYPRARILLPFAEPFPVDKPEAWSRRAWPALIAWLGLGESVQCDAQCKDPARLYFEPRKPAADSPHQAGFTEGNLLDWRTVPGCVKVGGGTHPQVGAPRTPHVGAEGDSPVGASGKRRVTLLSAATTPDKKHAYPAPPAEPEDPSRPVDLKALQKVLAGSSTECVRLLARGKELALPPSTRPPGELPRHMAWFYALGALSMAAEPWMATEALLELCRPSWHAEVDAARAPGDEPTPWEDVVAMLVQQRASAPAKRAEFIAARAKARELWGAALKAKLPGPKDATSPTCGAVSGGVGAGGGVSGGVGAGGAVSGGVGLSVDFGYDAEKEGDPPFDDDPPTGPGGGLPVLGPDELLEKLQLIAPPKGAPPDAKPTIKKSIVNLGILLRQSYLWRGAFRRNLVSDMVEIHGGPLFQGTVRDITDTDASRVRHWFAEHLGVEWSLDDVDKYVDMAAADFAYDPMANYLQGAKAKWDGTPRLNSMLETYFRVTPGGGEDGPPAEYIQAVSSKWMIGAVARALRPGCQMDTALVLHDEKGGRRKSTAVRVLGGALFSVFDYNLESDDAKAACSENWILEMGELSAMSKARREHIKMFMTKTADKFRPKYARRQVDHLRRCVFIGTTNDLEIFDGDDSAMERRFWPVTVGDIDVEALKRDRDQLWAEAVVRFEAGEAWYMDEAQEVLANAETAKRVRVDDLGERVEDWFARRAPENRPAAVRVMDIAKNILGEEGILDKPLVMRLAGSLRRLGFMRHQRMVNGVRAHWWDTPERLRGLPKQEGARLGGLSVVPPVASA